MIHIHKLFKPSKKQKEFIEDSRPRVFYGIPYHNKTAETRLWKRIMINKSVDEILNQISIIHAKKSKDYAKDDNPYSNFERASSSAEWFDDPVDKVFVTMLGIKLARLAELKNGKKPNNESLGDSMLDFCTYAVIWYAYYLENIESIPEELNQELRIKLDPLEFVHGPSEGMKFKDDKSVSPSQRPQE